MAINPLVSVIIPAYNAADYIAETLTSIANQTYGNIEVIVVDDGSTDRTAEVVEQFLPKVRYHYQANSGGCAVPRNTGIDHSNGQLLCFIDSDDLMTENRIELQVDFLQRHPEVGLVFCDYQNFTENGRAPDSHFNTCPDLSERLTQQTEIVIDRSYIHLIRENFGISGSFMLRRDLLTVVPGFEPTLRACEDFHFYYRLAKHTKTGIINKIGMLRRCHENNMSNNSVLMNTEGIRARSLLRSEERDESAIRRLDEYIANCWSSIARLEANRGRYLQSLRREFDALRSDLSIGRLKSSTRNFLRTLMMTLKLHKSTDK